MNGQRRQRVERTQEPHPAESMEQLTLDVYDLIPSKENFYSVEYINDLETVHFPGGRVTASSGKA